MGITREVLEAQGIGAIVGVRSEHCTRSGEVGAYLEPVQQMFGQDYTEIATSANVHETARDMILHARELESTPRHAHALAAGKRILWIAGGGDGTGNQVGNGVQEIRHDFISQAGIRRVDRAEALYAQTEVDVGANRHALATIPFGNGNDLDRMLHGKEDPRQLRPLAERLAASEFVDIWPLEVEITRRAQDGRLVIVDRRRGNGYFGMGATAAGAAALDSKKHRYNQHYTNEATRLLLEARELTRAGVTSPSFVASRDGERPRDWNDITVTTGNRMAKVVELAGDLRARDMRVREAPERPLVPRVVAVGAWAGRLILSKFMSERSQEGPLNIRLFSDALAHCDAETFALHASDDSPLDITVAPAEFPLSVLGSRPDWRSAA